MIFCVKSWENLTSKQLGHLPASLVYCGNFTLGNPSHFSTVGLLFVHRHTSDYLRYLRRKQTFTPLPTTPKNVTALPCKMHKFFIVSFFSTRIEYQCAIRTSCGSVLLRHGCISAEHGDDAVDQSPKRLEACIRAEGGHFEHLL